MLTSEPVLLGGAVSVSTQVKGDHSVVRQKPGHDARPRGGVVAATVHEQHGLARTAVIEGGRGSAVDLETNLFTHGTSFFSTATSEPLRHGPPAPSVAN
jgi:hypothetical protein